MTKLSDVSFSVLEEESAFPHGETLLVKSFELKKGTGRRKGSHAEAVHSRVLPLAVVVGSVLGEHDSVAVELAVLQKAFVTAEGGSVRRELDDAVTWWQKKHNFELNIELE